MSRFWYLPVLLLALVGCGRYFGGSILPMSEGRQGPKMTVRDDGSISYIFERLEINLRPVSDAELNRRFADYSTEGAESTNPYTYGNWKPMGDRWTPPKFTIFQLRAKNYTYPKMRVDPYKAELVSENGRRYQSLTLKTLLGYYQSYALGQAGNPYARFGERESILRQSLYPTREALFSGQEEKGYIVFPKLDDDVKDFSVILRDIVLRFDVRDIPVETINLAYRFHRDVYKGYYPPPSLTEKR